MAGIEVFLDQSELRGGDAWDQKIRHEIHDCATPHGRAEALPNRVGVTIVQHVVEHIQHAARTAIETNLSER